MKAEELAEEREMLRGTAEVFQALGDATRLKVVVQLATGGGRSIAELTEGTGLTRQAVTKHLRVLEEAGVVESWTHGREKLYELDEGPLWEAMACLDMVSAHRARDKHRMQELDRNPNKLTRETVRKSARGEEVHGAKDAKGVFEKLGI